MPDPRPPLYDHAAHPDPLGLGWPWSALANAAEAAGDARRREWVAAFEADPAAREQAARDREDALAAFHGIEAHFADLFLFQLRLALRHRPRETADLLAEAREVWKSFHPVQRSEPQKPEASKNGSQKA